MCSMGLEFHLKASASHWEIVEDAQMYSSSWRSSVAQTRSPSSSGSSAKFSGLESDLSSSSASSMKAGSGLVRQALTRQESSFWTLCSFLSSVQQPVQHQGRHWVILTNQAWKLISGLCFLSQVNPRIMLCLPSHVTAKRMHPEYII